MRRSIAQLRAWSLAGIVCLYVVWQVYVMVLYHSTVPRELVVPRLLPATMSDLWGEYKKTKVPERKVVVEHDLEQRRNQYFGDEYDDKRKSLVTSSNKVHNNPLPHRIKQSKYFPQYNHPQSNQTRGYFFLHVGPAKTGTTTLQQGLVSVNDTLWQADCLLYHYLQEAPRAWQSFFTSGACRQAVSRVYHHHNVTNVTNVRARWVNERCVRPLVHNLRQTKRQYPTNNDRPLSFFYSNEDLSTGLKYDPWDFAALQAVLRQALNLELVVVVSYRRYVDWLYSVHQHQARWTGRKPAWNAWPGISPKRRLKKPIDPTAGRVLPFVETALQYATGLNNHLEEVTSSTTTNVTGRHKLFPFYAVHQILEGISDDVPVRVLDLHANEQHPTLEFVCHVLPPSVATHTCRKLQAQVKGGKSNHSNKRLNAATSHDPAEGPTLTQYDHVVVAAYVAGRLTVPTHLTRRQADLWARYWHEHHLMTDWSAWICATEEDVKALKQWIWQHEEKVRRNLQRRLPATHAGTDSTMTSTKGRLLAPLDHSKWEATWDALVPKWCLVDAQAVLANATFDPLWKLLNNPSTPLWPPDAGLEAEIDL